MKKIFAIITVVALIFGIAGCVPVNRASGKESDELSFSSDTYCNAHILHDSKYNKDYIVVTYDGSSVSITPRLK